jgi:hypothetical protein
MLLKSIQISFGFFTKIIVHTYARHCDHVWHKTTAVFSQAVKIRLFLDSCGVAERISFMSSLLSNPKFEENRLLSVVLLHHMRFSTSIHACGCELSSWATGPPVWMLKFVLCKDLFCHFHVILEEVFWSVDEWSSEAQISARWWAICRHSATKTRLCCNPGLGQTDRLRLRVRVISFCSRHSLALFFCSFCFCNKKSKEGVIGRTRLAFPCGVDTIQPSRQNFAQIL